MSSGLREDARKKLLGQILKDMKAVHEGQIQSALQIQKKDGGRIGEILVKNGDITDAQLMLALYRSGRQADALRAEFEAGLQAPIGSGAALAGEIAEALATS